MGDIITIPRNSNLISGLQERLTDCRVFSFENGYSGQPCDPKWAWEAMFRSVRTRLTVHDDVYTISIHSNRWYELREAPAAEPAKGDASLRHDLAVVLTGARYAQLSPGECAALERVMARIGYGVHFAKYGSVQETIEAALEAAGI